ncbi:hypothetical protein F5887DRAFT_1083463 [Amanita rubescens]|nr:hypothetical protein F5887DRAFT_1083463 [Amanita rubescens]
MSKNQSPSQDDSSRSRSRGRLSTTLAALSAKIANTLNSPSEDGNPQAGSPKGPIPGAGFTRWGVQRSSSKGREEDQSTLSEAGKPFIGPDKPRRILSSIVPVCLLLLLLLKVTAPSPEAATVSTHLAVEVQETSARPPHPAMRDPTPGQTTFPAPVVENPCPVLPTDASGTHAFSTGRGGAGAVEDQLIRSHIAAEQDAVHSTGRGGIGNMTGGSRSRSRARDSTSNAPTSGTHTPLHSTGRGGAGNILSGHTPSVAEADEIDVIAHLPRHSDDVHSTGRGGAANITHAHAPPVEHTHHHHKHGEYESTGRGGAGNIVQT